MKAVSKLGLDLAFDKEAEGRGGFKKSHGYQMLIYIRSSAIPRPAEFKCQKVGLYSSF